MSGPILALLDGLGGPEVLMIAVIALLLFGSKRMPELGRGLGRAIREFKRATSGVEENLREVLYDEPARPKLRTPAQRRPYRDPTAHPEPPAPVPPPDATPAPTPTPDPHGVNFQEPAPPAMPDFPAEAAGLDQPTPERRDTAGPTQG